MAKKELPKELITPKNLESDGGAFGGNIKGKLSGLSDKAFGVTKFVLGLCLLPFVYSSSAAFLNEFNTIQPLYRSPFWSGIITLLVVYLFIWEPAVIYAKGQKMLEAVFKFFTPLVRVAPYLLPIYTVVLFVLYYLFSAIFSSVDWLRPFIFLFGFSTALHLVFGAKSLRGKKGDFLKSNYIFGFSFVYILNVALLALLLNLIFKEFSFVNFSNNTISAAKSIISIVFRQLFLP